VAQREFLIHRCIGPGRCGGCPIQEGTRCHDHQSAKPDITELKPRITVFGVGGGGGNAVNNMINAGLQGCRLRRRQHRCAGACDVNKADRLVQLGVAVTEGLGAGSQPEVGRAAAEEVHRRDQRSPVAPTCASSPPAWAAAPAPALLRSLPGAREKGILTVGVVTKPFHFEGQRRMRWLKRASRSCRRRRHADRHSEPEPVPHRQ
jgi:hypothetical protein